MKKINNKLIFLSVFFFVNLASAKEEIAAIQKEALDLVSAEFRAAIPKGLKLQFKKLTSAKIDEKSLCHIKTESEILFENEFYKNPISGVNGADSVRLPADKMILGHYNSWQNRIEIDEQLEKFLINKNETPSAMPCLHGDMYRTILATIIHEYAHAVDRNLGYPSRSAEFLKIENFSAFSQNKSGPKSRFPDNYGLTNASEMFAVMSEYFFLDQDFNCKMPRTNKFLSKIYKANRPCPNSYNIIVNENEKQNVVAISVDKLASVEYFMASAGDGLVSSFGHSMIRLNFCSPKREMGPKCNEDELYHLVASYRGNVKDFYPEIVKGINGDYRSELYFFPLQSILTEYNQDEFRNLESWPLKLNKEEKENLLLKLIEDHWAYSGKYKFQSNNCATETSDAILAALSDKPSQKLNSLTPKGVLLDLSNNRLLDLAVKRTYQSKLPHFIYLANSLYQANIDTNKSLDEMRKDLLFFIANSNVEKRKENLGHVLESIFSKLDSLGFEELITHRKTLAEISTFEQYTARYVAQLLGKHWMNMLSKSGEHDEDVKNLFKQLLALDIGDGNPENSTKYNYGASLVDNGLSSSKNTDQVATINELKLEIQKKLQVKFNERYAPQFVELEGMFEIIKITQMYSPGLTLKIGPMIKSHILQVVTSMCLNKEVENYDDASLVKIRNRLGKLFLDDKYVTDAYLKKLILEQLKK